MGVITRILPKEFCEVFGVNFSMISVKENMEILIRLAAVLRCSTEGGNARQCEGSVAITSHTKKCVFNDYDGPYREECKHKQYAQYAFDADVGYYLVRGKDFQLFAGAGPYYLCGHKSAVGARGWFRPQFSDNFSVEFSASYDRIYHRIYQVNVVFTIPLYRYSSLGVRSGPHGVTNRQIYQPIDRDIVVLDGKRCCRHDW